MKPEGLHSFAMKNTCALGRVPNCLVTMQSLRNPDGLACAVPTSHVRQCTSRGLWVPPSRLGVGTLHGIAWIGQHPAIHGKRQVAFANENDRIAQRNPAERDELQVPALL